MRNALATLAIVAVVVLSGCVSSTSGPVTPADDVKPTGRTLRFKAHVEDLFNTTLYPGPDGGDGLKANLWGFCMEPLDPNDAASVAAVEYWTPLPGDAPDFKQKAPSLYGKCTVPAPTLRVKQGDMIEVVFSNNHVHPHTIHWHGQYVSQENDGAPGVSHKAVESGESLTYKFMAKKAGTLWYHCHVDTQLHVQQGLYGMFIVEPADQSKEPEVDAEYKMVLGTLTRAFTESIPGVNPHNHALGCFTSGKPDCQNPAIPLDPDVFLINGHSYPLTMDSPDTLYKIKEGGKIRLRILNAGSTFETIHPHGQDMLVTHRDGNLLASPYWVDTLSIGPAERYDVVIEGTNPGAWMMHTHVDRHETNDGQSPGGMHTMLVYEGYEDKMHLYAAEDPGGQGYSDPIFLPSDYRLSTTYSLGTQASTSELGVPVPAGVDVSWDVPLEVACGAKTLSIDAVLSGGAATGQGSTLTMTVTGPEGQHFSGRLGRDTSSPANSPTMKASWDVAQAKGSGGKLLYESGNYTVRVTGSSLEGTLTLTGQIDYFGTFDEQRLYSLKHQTPVCGTYGYGTSSTDYQGPGK